MADKGKAVAGNDDPRKRQRRAREEELEDTATSRWTATAGGNGTLQELPRVTAATTAAVGVPYGPSSQSGGALDRGGLSGTRHGGFSQATANAAGDGITGTLRMLQPPGNPDDNGQRQFGLLRRMPLFSQTRVPGRCSACGRAAATLVAPLLKMPMCEPCFRDAFTGDAPLPHAQIGSMLPSPVPSYGGAGAGPSNRACYNYAQTGNSNVRPEHALPGNVSRSPVPSNAGAPQGQQQFRDSVAELLAATEPSRAGSQRDAYSRCEACRLSGDKACMFCHNPGPPPPPAGQS